MESLDGAKGGRAAIGNDGPSGPARAGRGGSWAGELLFLAMVALTVLGLPAAIFWYDGRLARAEPGRVINVIARNDQMDGRPGYWLVQRGAGWAYADAGAPAVIQAKQGELVTLRITAADSIHEFALPAYGIKEKVTPGHLTTVHFRVAQAGEFPFLCTAYCGIGHWQMGGKLVVEPQAGEARPGPTAAQAAAEGGS